MRGRTEGNIKCCGVAPSASYPRFPPSRALHRGVGEGGNGDQSRTGREGTGKHKAHVQAGPQSEPCSLVAHKPTPEPRLSVTSQSGVMLILRILLSELKGIVHAPDRTWPGGELNSRPRYQHQGQRAPQGAKAASVFLLERSRERE